MLIRSIKATIFKKLLSRIFAFFLKVLHICYTWPLGHRKKPLFKGFVNSWCRQQELNPQPTDYDSVALPIELCRQRAWISYENTADMSIFFPRLLTFKVNAIGFCIHPDKFIFALLRAILRLTVSMEDS